ncbi:MAG: hypothetical protein JW902_12110 [Syntrophaceae bacterium]|nr:hypothetical protein [Syntrophaceae bacterium]
MEEEEKREKVRPGMNPQVILTHFDNQERKIIERFTKDWYVTNGGGELWLSKTSNYRYALIKPTDIFQEMFNIDREIILLFSPYENFEPRTLDAISKATSKHQALRIERICSILISKDPDISSKLRELLKNDQEAQIVIPFTYKELEPSVSDPYFFRNRFIEHFYARDLFASESPLKKDLYFFGRTDLVHSLINRHRSNQVSGLFGLRKTGKTSVIFGVQRGLQKVDGVSAFIDCQTPAFHRLKWNQALHYVLMEVRKQNDLKERLGQLEDWTETQAAVLFEKHLRRMSEQLGSKTIMLIFDEVENITPTVSPTDHWREGEDFVLFWQTIRSLFQSSSKLFSYLLVGTNPLCVELPTVGTADNPLFAQIPLEYIPGFDVPQTREMVRRLGRIMGLKFDEVIYGKLTEDCGGHPYLMRHVCSVIHRISNTERPVRVDKTLYALAVDMFLRDYTQFLEMILSVLREYFNDEYEMLRMLSRGEYKTFQELIGISPLYTNHLLGYGVLQEVDKRFSFRIEVIRRHLEAKEKYKKLNMSTEEKWSEISERRNDMEQKLRKLCRMQLLAQLGEANARDSVLAILGTPRSIHCAGFRYPDLFDGNKSGILFSDLPKLIRKHWDCFSNILGHDKAKVERDLNIINEMRVDAHAKNITDEEMAVFRVSASRIEAALASFF